MKIDKNETTLIKYKAEDLQIDFPNNAHLTNKEKDTTKEAITRGGIVRDDGRAFINKDEMPKLLHTDKKGANKVYNNLDNEDKFQDGNLKYADAAAVSKEVSNRIQEPRSQLEREKLKYSRDSINALIDSPTLEKERTIEADRIQYELPKLTKKKIKAENITCDQLTGEEFDNDAVGHHKERKSDNPKKALDPDNILVIKKKNHDEIHNNGAEDEASLKKLAQEKGWNEKNI